MKLAWSDYKSVDGSRSVWFGSFTLYVHRHDKRFRRTKTWRVHWYEGPPIRPLTDRRFRTRANAQRAAEAVFVPLLEIAPRMVRVTATAAVTDVLAPERPRKRKPTGDAAKETK